MWLASLSWAGRMSGQMPVSDGCPSRRGVFGRRLDCRPAHRLGSLVPVYACALRSRPDGRAVGTCVGGYPWTCVSLARGAWVCACVCGWACFVVRAGCSLRFVVARVCGVHVAPGIFLGLKVGTRARACCVWAVVCPSPSRPRPRLCRRLRLHDFVDQAEEEKSEGRGRRGTSPSWSVVGARWLFPLFVFGSCLVGGGLICSAGCSLSLLASLFPVLLI